MLQQETHDWQVAVQRCQDQWRVFLGILGVDAGTGSNQHLTAVKVAFTSRQVERCVALLASRAVHLLHRTGH